MRRFEDRLDWAENQQQNGRELLFYVSIVGMGLALIGLLCI